MRLRIVFAIIALFALCGQSLAWPAHGNSAPPPAAPDVRCVIAGTVNGVSAGNCTGTSPFTFTAATCDGVADDVTAFNSFNSAANTWQASNPGLLIELDAQSGKTCEFVSGDVNHNNIFKGLKRAQYVGYGSTLADANGTGGGFALGGGSQAGMQFNGTSSTVLVATVSVGATAITILDTSKCSLWNAGNWAYLTGIDPQGFGDPPNPPIFDFVQIVSTASCAGSGQITISAPLLHSYKSTWPGYNQGTPGLTSNDGGPATLYQLTPQWDTEQSWYGVSIDQKSGQTNANGRSITLRDVSCTNIFCVIPSQNQTFTVINGSFGFSDIEFDKIVGTVNWTNVTVRQVKIQQPSPRAFNCTSCVITNSMQGTAGVTTFVGGSIADLQIGAISYGSSGAFSATNTAIAALETSGSGLNNIDTRGIWASGTLTVPANMSVSAAISCGATCTELTVGTSAGWSSGLTLDISPGSGSDCGNFYAGTWSVTVVDATHISIPVAFTSTCSASIGNLPLTWAVPRTNVYFTGGSHGFPIGPILQVADLSVGANSATVVSFNQNGSPYAGGLPTMPGGPPFNIFAHPAPSWNCSGCTGAINVTDVTGVPAGPFGSQATRILTAANSGNATVMPVFGPLSELDMLVTAACSGASSIGLEQTYFTATLGSTSFGSWNPTANGLISSATPRVVMPTTSSGAQSGDSLVTPGAGTLILLGQSIPFYSSVANCGSASTAVTIKTNQGVVYPYLLRRDLGGPANDNRPAFINKTAA